jgi:hypothetical protein
MEDVRPNASPSSCINKFTSSTSVFPDLEYILIYRNAHKDFFFSPNEFNSLSAKIGLTSFENHYSLF